MKLVRAIFWLVAPWLAASLARAGAAPPLSDETMLCVSCHSEINPGLAHDWQLSRHARTTPAAALAGPAAGRRISATEVPEALRDKAVGCYECHGLNPDQHADTFDHFGFRIHTVVTPNDCATCHPVEAEQYGRSKKAFALDNLQNNNVFHALVDTSLGVPEIVDGQIRRRAASDETKNQTCYGCHGTKVEVIGQRQVATELGPIEIPILSGWPNMGVGRHNPDGSRGSCASCHARHEFSLAVARSPETCGQCHLEPDVPAYNVYKESKHGNLYSVKGKDWDLTAVPWVPGQHFQAPTCATCHNAELRTPGGDVIVERTHDFGERLWVRIFGLPYSHPQPVHGNTTTLRNAAGQPLPTTFAGQPAAEGLIDEAEQLKRQGVMRKVCTSCHGGTWADGWLKNFTATVKETDELVLASTKLMQEAWAKGLADPANPFDEAIEYKWLKQWLYYANSIRYGAAMMGPDYMAFKNGWFPAQEGLQEMAEWIRGKGR